MKKILTAITLLIALIIVSPTLAQTTVTSLQNQTVEVTESVYILVQPKAGIFEDRCLFINDSDDFSDSLNIPQRCFRGDAEITISPFQTINTTDGFFSIKAEVRFQLDQNLIYLVRENGALTEFSPGNIEDHQFHHIGHSLDEAAEIYVLQVNRSLIDPDFCVIIVPHDQTTPIDSTFCDGFF